MLSKDDVRKIYAQLEKLGYSVSHDWTQHESIKSYSENPERAEEYAIADMKGASKSDLIIILTDEAGTGMHTELGGAINNFMIVGKPLIYAIGEHFNTNLFFFHPAVRRRKTIEKVIKELKRLKLISLFLPKLLVEIISKPHKDS